MALVFCDGFERTTLGQKWANPGYNGTNTNRARTGSRSASYAFSAGTWCPTASGSTFIFSVGIYMTTLGSWEIKCAKDTVAGGGAAGQIVGVYIHTNGAIYGKIGGMGAYGTAMANPTAPNVFRYNQWNHIEGKCVIHDTTGSVVVKLNGETVLNLTNVDTKPSTQTDWNAIYTQLNDNGNMDDLVIADGSGSANNDFLGQCRVVTILPVTDAVDAGAHADFTCLTSTDHGAMVDEESSDDDTTYVYSSTLNHIDSWNFAALGYTGTIKGVQLDVAAKKTESGTRAIRLLTRPVSTDRIDTTDRYLGQTNYDRHLKLWELNPDDSAAWEVADVDGAEFGVKVSV